MVELSVLKIIFTVAIENTGVLLGHRFAVRVYVCMCKYVFQVYVNFNKVSRTYEPPLIIYFIGV